MTRRNSIALAVALAALALAVAWALRPQPIGVETAPVARGPFEQTVSDDGRTRVRERYVVSAPLAGRVEREPHPRRAIPNHDDVGAGRAKLAAAVPRA